ncbi:tubulin epsilon chain isoform X1 [Carcharodon carcharias]|uniref:tubulin epsilon chain isoform X1 n=2 Tax=Carcharodon carcharias TaxID=13397 RepID=UPI001B7EAEE5|nr:tubulin epsilon chain isoform X1 [Carcharodon carcharias]
MTQSVLVQVGQCGNQVGCRFWDLVLREHANVNKKGIYDEALSNFFRNVDTRSMNGDDINLSKGIIRSLKARAVLIDMEEGVVNELLQGPLRDVFDSKQLITDVSGSGNNWAVGYKQYGCQYRDQILGVLRKTAEHCDSLQCFFLIHSMGGGTGSGLGTFVLSLLEDEFPEVYRFVTSVYPSAEDDVITSPYNSVLAMKELTEHADCVLPIENQSLIDIVNKINQMVNSGKLASAIKLQSTLISGHSEVKQQEKPFDAMNNIVANLLLNLTSSARFEGSLNMDLNEITMNLVPFPRLHYLVSSLTPLYTLADVNIPIRRLDQMFTDAFSKDHQLMHADPKRNLYLACALMVRGNVQISDLRRNIERLKPSLQFVSWNQEGWKTSLCSIPPVGHTHSLLALANNTCVRTTFIDLKDRFVKLYKKKAHIHHYLHVDGMEQSCFTEANNSLSSLIEEYNQLDATKGLTVTNVPRLSIAV